MKQIVLTHSSLLSLVAYFMFCCPATNIAQENLETSTAICSVPIMVNSVEDEPEEILDYHVGTWSSPVTKEEVKKITSIEDFWGDEDKAKYKHDSFRDIWVVNLKDYHDWKIDVSKIEPGRKVTGPTKEFTKEQLALVANADYSDHLRFSARFKSTKISTGEVEENVLISQSVCIVPDVQAVYKGGFDTLVIYLKEASKELVKHVKRDTVGSCKIYFTVSSNGSIASVRLVETSNYTKVDKGMLKIIKNMPQMWTPAQNDKEENVDQEFVFTFGRAGC